MSGGRHDHRPGRRREGDLRWRRARCTGPDHLARRGRRRRGRHRDLGVQPGSSGRHRARGTGGGDSGLRAAADGGRAAVLRTCLPRRPAGGAGALRRPGPVGRDPGAAGPVRRAGAGHRDRAGRVQLHRGRRRDRPGTDHSRGGPVGDPHPARRRQDPDAARGADRQLRPARHHDGAVPVRRAVGPAAGGVAARRLRPGHPMRGRLPGDLAGRADRALRAGRPGRHHQSPQTVEAHPGAGRPGPERRRHPLPPLPPGALPRLPPG